MIGARLAGEPGRGRRAVPVRSALVGAIAGVIGVVGCLTFRAGIEDAVHEPRRSGVVWNYVARRGRVGDPRGQDRRRRRPGPRRRRRARRPVGAGGAGRRPADADVRHEHGEGRDAAGRAARPAPDGPDEIAFAPTTMRALGLPVGDRVRVGSADGTTVTVVGEALLPATSHTDYDQSGWMTAAGLRAGVGRSTSEQRRGLPAPPLAAGVRRRRGDPAARPQIGGDDLFAQPATLPAAVADLAPHRGPPPRARRASSPCSRARRSRTRW